MKRNGAKLPAYLGCLSKNNLYIDDSSGLTPTELRSRARRVYRAKMVA